MATQKPLREMIDDIVLHIEANQDYLQFNLRVFNVLEGQIKEEVENSLRDEILSPAALRRCLQRIPPVNVLKRTTDKLSKVYIEAPVRRADSESDLDIMDSIVKVSNMDASFMQCNRILVAQNSCALEPYVKDKKQRVRVLPNHTFLPYSDDPSDPMNMTVFIKLLGSEKVVDKTTYDKTGNNKEQERDNIRVIDIFQVFSDDEILVMDTAGHIREDWMEKLGLDGKNPFGVIPQTYVNSSQFMLMPFPNQAGMDASVLIPKLLTDLNYAAQFLSHSILWSRNTDLKGAEINPDVVVDLGSGGGTQDLDGMPEIGSIDPKVEIEAQLQLIEFEIGAHLSTLGIKGSTQGSMMPGREASGFAKAMDESDASSARKELTEVFRHVEQDFWSRFDKIQKVWSNDGAVAESRVFSSEFAKSFSIKFAEMKILKTDKEKLDEIKTMRAEKLMSKKQAIKEMKPTFTDAQIQHWIDEIESEIEVELEKEMEMMMPADGSEVPPSNPVTQARNEELGK